MSHQRNKEEGEEDRENRERVRQMLYEKVQVNKEVPCCIVPRIRYPMDGPDMGHASQEHEERRTEHPQGKEFSSTWRYHPSYHPPPLLCDVRCRPIRVIHEKSRKENVQALIVYMPDHEAAKVSFPRSRFAFSMRYLRASWNSCGGMAVPGGRARCIDGEEGGGGRGEGAEREGGGGEEEGGGGGRGQAAPTAATAQ
eukprot:1790611-Rhodomonas_salina.1